MDQNKFSYWENIWKSKYKLEKINETHQIQNHPVDTKGEYKLDNEEMKETYVECNLRVGFVDTFKANNHILFCIWKVN